MIGAEPAGKGLATCKHAAPSIGKPGLCMVWRYVMQDAIGNLTHLLHRWLDYPGVGPEHSRG